MISASNYLARGSLTVIALAIAAGLSWFSFTPIWPGVAGYYLTLAAMGFAYRIVVEIGRVTLPLIFKTDSGADILIVTGFITISAGAAVFFLFPGLSFSPWLGLVGLAIRGIISLFVLAMLNLASKDDGVDL